jgi:hypothetical protein
MIPFPEANWEPWVAIGTGALALATFFLNVSQFVLRYMDRARIAIWITPRTTLPEQHSIVVQAVNEGGRPITLMGLGVSVGKDPKTPLLLDSVTIAYSKSGLAPSMPSFPATLFGGQVGQWYLLPRALVEAVPTYLFIVDTTGKRHWRALPLQVVALIEQVLKTPVPVGTDEYGQAKRDPYG